MKKPLCILAILLLLPACGQKEGTAPNAVEVKKAFFEAVSANRPESVKRLLAQGADASARDENGMTALHHARHGDMVKILLAKGTEVNATDNEGRTPLDLALDHPYPHVAMLLSWYGAKTSKTPPRNVAEAAMIGRVGEVRDFLAAGCDVNTKDMRGYAALHYAAMRRDQKLCHLLIDWDADLDAHTSGRYYAPLHIAADSEVVKLLAASGADMDATAIYGWTALHYAVDSGKRERAKLLLREGANVNAAQTSSGSTPLDLAHYEGMKKLLLSHGAVSGKELREKEE